MEILWEVLVAFIYQGETNILELLEKQKKGKKKMQEMGTVNIPQDVFIKMIRPDE